VTITLDRERANTARALLGETTTPEVIDVALERLIRTERLDHDVAAYAAISQEPGIVEIDLLGATAGPADETDWAALYDDSEQWRSSAPSRRRAETRGQRSSYAGRSRFVERCAEKIRILARFYRCAAGVRTTCRQAYWTGGRRLGAGSAACRAAPMTR
jgi:hypothetical protein